MTNLIVTFLFFNSFYLFADTAKLKFSNGDVSLKSAKGKAIKIKKGFVIPNGSTILTGKKAIALIEIKSNKAVKMIKVDQLSELRITNIKDQKGKTNLDLNLGAVFVKYLKKTAGAEELLDIRSRSVVMGVRGTEFFVVRPANAKQAKDVWMCVNEGIVEVKNIDGTNKQLVKKGQGIHVKDGKKITPPKSYPWTQKLNWNMDPKKGDLDNKIELESAYRDLLDYDYD